MAPPTLSFSFLVVLLFSPLSIAAASPKALLAPITLDPLTLLYSFSLGNKYSLLLDVGNSNLWLDCVNPPYQSPTLALAPCRTAVCNSARVCNANVCASGAPGCGTCFTPPSPICRNNSCSVPISNSATSTSTGSTLWIDTFSVVSTDGRNPGPLVRVPKLAFACTDNLLLKSLPSGVVGDAGLSRASIALPTQLASKLSLARKFTYCLPSTSNGKGVLFFGDTPIVFQPDKQLSSSFQYTPLLTDTKEPDSYFLGVNSISVTGAKLSIDSNLLKIKSDRTGGTIISSTERYTRLEPSIYDAVASAFKAGAKASGIEEVAAVSPFDTCFNASTAHPTRVGYNVPEIALALQGSGGVVWRFTGTNTVVSLEDDKVICLAFQRRGEFERRAIVLGTFQQQEVLLQFDLATSRLGFVPTLFGSMTTCANFNFTM